MSSNYPNAYPPYHGYPPLPAAATAPAPASAQGSAADPYAAYYAQMMADPAYAAYAAQYYAAYGASTTVAAASDPHSSSATAPPVSLDLDQVILKSEITRKPASAMKSKTAAATASAPSAAAGAAASSSTAQGGTDSAQAAATTTNGDAPAVDASATRKKKRKADSEKSKADKDKVQEQEEDQPQAKKKRMIRYAAGQVWEDKSLIEWPDNDYRLFVGDLGPEVMTQTLEQAFGKYASFQKAHVVRDQRTGKSKGYGFVSFMNGEDFVKAFQEYNNKYLGSRPVKLRKSTWQERNIEKKKEKLAKIFK